MPTPPDNRNRWVCIDNELSRKYSYAPRGIMNGMIEWDLFDFYSNVKIEETVEVKNPVWLLDNHDGSARIIDAKGAEHEIPKGWIWMDFTKNSGRVM